MNCSIARGSPIRTQLSRGFSTRQALAQKQFARLRATNRPLMQSIESPRHYRCTCNLNNANANSIRLLSTLNRKECIGWIRRKASASILSNEIMHCCKKVLNLGAAFDEIRSKAEDVAASFDWWCYEDDDVRLFLALLLQIQRRCFRNTICLHIVRCTRKVSGIEEILR